MKHIFLAVDTKDIFGTIKAPVDDPLYTSADPNAALGAIISFIIQGFFFVAGIASLFYLLWGAFDWVTSEGQKEKVAKAQNKIMYAVVGLVLMVVVVVIFNVVMGTVLGGKFGIQDGLKFSLPTIGGTTGP